jgi:DNA polymerase III alpha subunit
MKSDDTGRLAWVMSAFSFRWGTDTPESLAEAARRAGFAGVLMTDLGGVYGAIRLAAACGRLGVGAIPGARLRLSGGRITVGALEGGWGQLCRLITASHLPDRVDPSSALEDSDRLFAVAGPGPRETERLRSGGFRGRIYVPVPPGSVLPDLPAGTLPLPARPCMFAGPESPGVHEILRRVDRLLESPWVTGELLPDHRMPVASADSWPRRALEAGRELLETVSGEPAERRYDPPEIGPDDPGLLRSILLARLGELYPGAAAAEARLDMEFEALAGAGLCGYFLIFHEILSYCRENEILAVARGSAGGSLVARLLGLSAVCPIRWGLSFHRFFNPLRSRPPDIDLDIDSSRRDQVFDWFLRRWGARAAAVSVLGAYRSRSAVRFSAAAAGMGPEEIEALSRASGNPGDPVWARGDNGSILREAGLLKGLPAGIGPHPCGLVVCNGPVESRVPVQGCSGGLEVTQFDKDGVEHIGLLKMDLLGHRGLSALASASRDPLLELAAVQDRLDEPAVLLLSRGATIGVPHVESPAMRGLLREMNPSGVEDVARALALVRPGASAGGGRERYAAGGDPRTPACLSNLLRENRGVMLYQEDVSEAACVLLGLPPDRGDLMRRRLKAGSVGREEIAALCLAAGHSPETAEKGWELLSGYAGYGFCKAHAVTYAVEACAFAGLKTRCPARAMAAFMAAGGGFYNPRVYVEEARRMGIGILPPGVNTGEWLCRPTGDGSLMLGFSLIRGMGSTEYGKLAGARPHLSPASVRDSGIGPGLASVMAAAGCFDEMGLSRSEAAWAVKCGGFGLFPEGLPPPPLPGYTREYRVLSEMEAMGVTTEVHPLEIMERPPGTVPAWDPPRRGRFSLWGRAVSLRSLGGGAGFVMLEDPTGVADVFLPAPGYRDAERILRRPGATLVLRCSAGERGRVSAREVLPGPVLG